MSESFESYAGTLLDAAEQASHAYPWLLDLKQKARRDFEKLGFPSKLDEDWKYTSSAKLLEHTFVAAKKSTLSTNSAPNGVVMLPLTEAIESHAELIQPYLGQILEHTHGFHALNTALFEEGMLIYIPEGVSVDEPIVLTHKAAEPNSFTCFRHLVVAAPNSSCTLIEEYEGCTHEVYFTHAITEVALEAAATVIHGKLQREGLHAFHVSEVVVRQAEDSVFESHSVSLGGQWVRSDTHIEFEAPRASCVMNGMYAPRGRQHMDHHTTVDHAVPGCVSAQDYKGILDERARAVFNGKVLVAEGARATEASQSNKNVLLSPHAEVNTKPELQIFEGDIVCSHGATVGELDENALFYLATRGIDEHLAQQYLIQAFFDKNLGRITQPDLKARASELLNQHLSYEGSVV